MPNLLLSGLPLSGGANHARGYSASLLQAAAALYGADAARLLGEQHKSPQLNRKMRA